MKKILNPINLATFAITLRKIAAILFLILFCVYAFTFKTRYCFLHGTNKRDYQKKNTQVIKEALKKGKLADYNFFPSYSYCIYLVKNAQIYETKILPLKNYSTDALIIPPAIKIPVPEFSSCDWNIPETRCRGSTTPFVTSLRGPPHSPNLS